MSEDKSPFVVSADWVEKNLGAPEFRIVDASWYLPAQNRSGAEEYAGGHIPGAVFFDQDAIADHSTGLPHTLPSAEMFATEIGKLGIADTDTIVVYDGPGIFSAPRVWFLFRVMGAKKVYVMDGGLDGWKKEGRPLTSDLPEPRPATFHAHFDQSRITSLEAMRDIVARGTRQIADARGAGRFAATEPEPRPGMFKSLPELREMFDAAGIDLTRPVVTSCGSGITAAIITLALTSLGHGDNTLYDGSWSEWGGRDDTPVVTGKD